MTEVPTEVSRMVAEMIGDFNREMNARESERAKADPRKYRMSKVMEGKHGLHYNWRYAGKDGWGRAIYFCWSSHRNVAGFFLGWREVHGKKLVKRDQWAARRTRRRLIELAERRAAAFGKRRQPAPPAPPAESRLYETEAQQ